MSEEERLLRAQQRARLASRPSVPTMEVEAGSTWLKWIPASGMNNIQLLKCTLAIVCLLHAADGAMLPAVFKALEEAVERATPQSLGMVAMLEALCHSLAVLVWGVLADRGSKLLLLTISTAVWGFITLATATCNSMLTLAVVRAAAGIVSAALGPLAQGMIVAVCEPEGRGRAFGFIIGAGYMGHMLGLFLAGSVAHVSSMGGWRAPFCIFAALTLGLSSLLSMMWMEARSGFLSQSRVWHSLMVSKGSGFGCGNVAEFFVEAFANLGFILRRRSFLVLILQGAFASTGIKAMTYMSMWFQYQGFADVPASTLICSMPLGCIFGALAAGYISDELAKLYPDHGRISFGMVVMVLQLVVLVLMFIPGMNATATDANFRRFLVLMFLYGAVSVMAYTGAIRPLFTEIVPIRLVGQVIAFGAAIDGAIASVGGNALVGYITQHLFGYQPTSLTIAEMPEELREQNATALAQAISCVSLIAALVTVMAFVLLHCTFVDDRAASRREDLLADAAVKEGSIPEAEHEDDAASDVTRCESDVGRGTGTSKTYGSV
mmetsp:Transcript_36404/g.66684  ORF Transcript_36404/g.66684 Transcript_36404/m.66684 type:complete len:549 (-) Transcript_36404:39-1685(-)